MRAPTWASRPATGWLAGCLVVAAVVAAGSVAPVEPTVPAGSARGGGSEQVAVARASLVCPAPEQGDATATTLAVAAPGSAVDVLPGGPSFSGRPVRRSFVPYGMVSWTDDPLLLMLFGP